MKQYRLKICNKTIGIGARNSKEYAEKLEYTANLVRELSNCGIELSDSLADGYAVFSTTDEDLARKFKFNEVE